MASTRRQPASAGDEPNPNVFDDEYAVDVPETELDHRPMVRSTGQEPDAPTRLPSQSSIQSRARRRSRADDGAQAASSPQRMLRKSIAKDPREFLAGAGSAAAMPSSHADPHLDLRSRPISTASDFAPFEDRSATPISGRNTGIDGFNGFSQSSPPRSSFASHSPPRRLSVATRARPAQPYALYNQSGLAAEEDEGLDATLPVGFHGRADAFERRIGPDGEEQDIVGPDGHTEQMPPYSKYPEGDTKIVTTATSTANAPALSPILPSPTSPIVEAPQRTPALEAAAAGSAGGRSDSTIDEKKSWKEKTFTEKRRTRVCWGMPLWVLVTIIGVVLLCGAIIGGVVGGLLAAENKRKSPIVTVTSTAMLDASPIPTPSGVAPIPTGVYGMPFGIPQEQQKSCLTQTSQYNTWGCNVPPQPILVKINSPSSENQLLALFPNSTATSSNGNPPRYSFSYGPQYPAVFSPQKLSWVEDVEEPNRGPALHFQTMYDKLVILDDNDFSPSGSKLKRDSGNQGYPYEPQTYTLVGSPFYATPAYSSPSAAAATTTNGGSAPTPDPLTDSLHHRKNTVSVGDQPWFCWWNQTWLEGFVYVNSYTSLNHSSSKLRKREADSSITTAPAAQGLVDRDVHLRGADFEHARAMWREAMAAHEKRMASPAPSSSSSPASSSSSSSSSSSGSASSSSPFPYVMKVQERRIPGQQSKQPYCQKMIIPADGPPQPYLDANNKPVIANIAEDSASFQAQQSDVMASATASGNAKRSVGGPRQLAELLRRDASQNSCHCLWVSTPPSS